MPAGLCRAAANSHLPRFVAAQDFESTGFRNRSQSSLRPGQPTSISSLGTDLLRGRGEGRQ